MAVKPPSRKAKAPVKKKTVAKHATKKVAVNSAQKSKNVRTNKEAAVEKEVKPFVSTLLGRKRAKGTPGKPRPAKELMREHRARKKEIMLMAGVEPAPSGRPERFGEKDFEMVIRLVEAGATDKSIAEHFGISVTTYKRKCYEITGLREEIAKALERYNLSRVKRSLVERAIGYTHHEEKLFAYKGEIIRAKTTKHYPPDPQAIAMVLYNKAPSEWGRRPQLPAIDPLATMQQLPAIDPSQYTVDELRLLEKLLTKGLPRDALEPGEN